MLQKAYVTFHCWLLPYCIAVPASNVLCLTVAKSALSINLYRGQVVEDLQSTGRVAHAFITLMFGPCVPNSSQPKKRQASAAEVTPSPVPSGDARQCFQSAGSSLWQHLYNTASPKHSDTPESDSGSLEDMQVEHPTAPPSCQMAALPTLQNICASESLSPCQLQGGFAATLLQEAHCSPRAHDRPHAKPQLPSCKRRLFKS